MEVARRPAPRAFYNPICGEVQISCDEPHKPHKSRRKPRNRNWHKPKPEPTPVVSAQPEEEKAEGRGNRYWNKTKPNSPVASAQSKKEEKTERQGNRYWHKAKPKTPAPVVSAQTEKDEKADSRGVHSEGSGSSSGDSGHSTGGDEETLETTLPAYIPPIEDHEREAIKVIKDTELRIAHEWAEYSKLSKGLRKPRSHYECVESAMYRRVRIWDESEDKHEDRKYIDDHLRIYGYQKEGKDKERAIRVARWLLNDTHKTSVIQRWSYAYDVVNGKVVVP